MVDLTQKNDNETLNAFNFAAEIQKNVKPTVKLAGICSTSFLNRKKPSGWSSDRKKQMTFFRPKAWLSKQVFVTTNSGHETKKPKKYKAQA